MPPAARAATWLVTGATGAVGPAIVDELAAAGANVRVLVRSGPGPGESWPWRAEGSCIEVVRGDVRDESAMRAAADGATYVVHAAGLAHRRPRSRAEAAELFEANTGGARTVARAASDAAVERVVFISSASVYGPGDGDRRDEAAATAPATAYARSKLESEIAMSAMLGERLTVLRVSAVAGPRVGGQYERLARAVRSPWPIPVIAGRGHCLIADHRLALVTRLVATDQASAGATYNVCDGDEYTVRDIVRAMSDAQEVPAWRVPTLPRWSGSMIASVLGATGGAEWTRRQRLHSSISSMIHGPRLDISALRRALPGLDLAADLPAWRGASAAVPR